MVGVGAVDEDLHLGVAKAQLPREVRADTNDAVHLSREHEFLACGIEVMSCARKIRRELEAGSQLVASGDGSSSTTATGTFFTSSDNP